ncbi:MAG: maltotransferase domain-containing protein, partial [Pseudonocardiaceae bacterium]
MTSDKWTTAAMTPLGNDRWAGVMEPATVGGHEVVVEAWTDREATLQRDMEIKRGAGLDVSLEVAELAALSVEPDDLTTALPTKIWVDRQRAASGAWYELFPRSVGGFLGACDRLPAVAAMGFDVVYLPPIHPIGTTARKGRNNTLVATLEDPGSPWAIGSSVGGHTAVEPALGTIEDFDLLVSNARDLGLEIALDYALQCSPDHPWVGEHPEWFHRRSDGSIRYAENPPKRYEDIFPINFWPDAPGARSALWEACADILRYWISHGVAIFRVDNPHTKPMAFWEWLIPEIQAAHPEVIFLAEAFTRPKMMAKLAEIGFSQSYTYFTWRTTKAELRSYAEEVCLGPTADYMRPNFWPTTPDILAGPLRDGPMAAFALRLVLAATLVTSFGIYSGFEIGENLPAADTNEEYFDSEKYRVQARTFDRADSLVALITSVNT